MRILNIICSTNPAHGGPMEWVRQYGVAAQNLGHQVELVSMDPPNAKWLDSYPLKVYALGSKFRYFYCPQLVPWILKHAPNYDQVIAHGLWRYPSLATWRAMTKIDKPYFIYTHGMLAPWFKKNFPLKHIAKWLYWPWTDYRVLADAKAVLFTCEQEMKQASKSFWLYRANEIVAPLGIADPELNHAKSKQLILARFPDLADKQILLFLGRIHKIKGCDLLIKAFSQLAKNYPNLQLVMAGPDPADMRTDLTNIAKSYGIESRLVWTGMLNDSMKWAALDIAEAVVLPSHHENFSFTVVEAMANSTPVLITDQVGIWREIEHYNAGLVAADTLQGVQEILEKWLQLTDQKRVALQRNARRCFVEQFEITHATNHLLNTITKINPV